MRQEFMKRAGAMVTAVTFGLSAAGCAVQGLPRQELTVDGNVQNVKVALNPCEREGIKVRPVWEVSQGELSRRERGGEEHYQYRNYHLFSPKSVSETWAPVVGAVAIGLVGSRIGTGVVSAAASVSGAFVGGAVGDKFSTNSRIERMARESGCEHYLDNSNKDPNKSQQRPSGRTTYPAVDDGYRLNSWNNSRGHFLLPPPRSNPFN